MQGIEGYEHITIKLHPCKDYATDFALAQASGEQIDLVSTPGLSENTEIKNGSFLALDDLLAANPEVTADLPDWFVELGNIFGATYYVPNYQQCANQFFLYMNKEYFEQSGYTYDEAQTILLEKDFDKVAKFYEDVNTAVREYTGKDTVYIRDDKISNPRFWINNATNMYGLDWWCFFYWDVEKEEIAFTEYNENIKKGYLKQAEWYLNGMSYENSFTDSAVFDNGFLGETTQVWNLLQSSGTPEMVAATRNTEANLAIDGEVIVFDVDNYAFINASNAAGGTAVSATCENPEEAVKVMALLFNSKYAEFYNTLVYGLEGIHYNVVSDGVVETTEFAGTQGGADTTYCFHKWRGGNTFNAWLNQSMTQEQEDFILNEINESETTVKTPLRGFVLDAKPVENEITQLKAVVAEYHEPLRHGIMGEETESYYNEFIEKMETAGLSKVLEEFNRQADEFLASK